MDLNDLKIMTLSKRLIKSGLQRFGFDIIRTKNNPAQTLLGLKARPIRTVIDVGANTGQFAKEISTIFTNANIYCFEPIPEAFAQLSSWANTQNGKVFSFNYCLGEKEGEVEMYYHENHTPSSSLLVTTELTERYYPITKKQRIISVKQKTLDDALEELQTELLSEIIIKLDVQGYEKYVIAGAYKTFANASACIVEINFDKIYHGQSEFNELLILFEKLGYYYGGNLNQVYAEDGHCVFCDAVFLKSIPLDVN